MKKWIIVPEDPNQTRKEATSEIEASIWYAIALLLGVRPKLYEVDENVATLVRSWTEDLDLSINDVEQPEVRSHSPFGSNGDGQIFNA